MKIIGFCFHAGFLQFLGVFQVIKANPGFCYEYLGKWSMIHFSIFFGLKHQQGDYTIPIILEGFFNSNYQASPLKTNQSKSSWKVAGGSFCCSCGGKKNIPK